MKFRRKVAGFLRWLAPIAEELMRDYIRSEIETKVGREMAKARNRGDLMHPGEELTGQLPSQHER